MEKAVIIYGVAALLGVGWIIFRLAMKLDAAEERNRKLT